ncbi:MAG: class I SAM-dependent methyltransferase [Deltaproteobacteria bacterium]|nr:class I SAM-dependent methyltransferase [Deltaproteobacteria bacterium]
MKPEIYRLLHRGTPADLPFYRELCSGKTVLELGCGYGRVLEALSDSRSLTAIDIDRGLLRLAAEGRHGAQLIEMDMRGFELPHRYERIIAPYNALYCLSSQVELEQTIEQVARHLTAEGVFAFDLWNADGLEIDANELAEEEQPTFVVQIDLEGETLNVFEANRWEPQEQRVTADYFDRKASGEDLLLGTNVHRYFFREQIDRALALAGLTEVDWRGSFGNEPWSEESEHSVICAAKAARR